MDSNRMDNTILSKNSIELMNKELEKMNKLQANMMEEAKKLLDSAELRQIEQSYKQYEEQIKAIQKKVATVQKQFIPITQQVRDLIGKSVAISQKIEGCYTQSSKNIQKDVNRIMEKYNVEIPAPRK
jgi:chromosome segregation ATPase